jgi:tight adherence protein C
MAEAARFRFRAGRTLLRLGRNPWAWRLVRVETVRRRLELAGIDMGLDIVVGVEAVVALCGGLGTLALGLLIPPAFFFSPIAPLVTARGFELALARRARRRQGQMGAAVPDLVELLVATTDAGLSPGVALRRTAEMLRGPLGEELRRAVSEVEFGLPWQRALERMVARSEVPSLRALAAALSRSQQLGTVLGSTLRRVAEDLRTERRTRAEEVARKAPIKMLFPLVFLILPAFLLLTVGPVVLATIRSLH